MPLSLFHLHGDLKDLRFPRLLAALREDDFTGVFQATTRPESGPEDENEATREVHFSAGHIAWAISTEREESLRAYLLRTGTLTETRWAEAEEKAREGTLRQALIDLGVVNARELTQIEKGRAEEIVLALFSARQGEYRVRERQLSPGTPDLRIDPRPLILKGVLEGGDRSLILDEVGSLDTVYVVKRPVLEEPGLNLPGEFQSVLRHIDGKRSIAKICSLTSLPDYFVCSVFAALSMIGAVRRNYEKTQAKARGEIVKGIEVSVPAATTAEATAAAEPIPAPEPAPVQPVQHVSHDPEPVRQPVDPPPISRRPFPGEGPVTRLERSVDLEDDSQEGAAEAPVYADAAHGDTSRPWFLLGGAAAVGFAALFLILMAQNPGDAGEVAKPVSEALTEPQGAPGASHDDDPLDRSASNPEPAPITDPVVPPAAPQVEAPAVEHKAAKTDKQEKPYDAPPPGPVATRGGSNILKTAPRSDRADSRSGSGRDSLAAGDYLAASRYFGREVSSRAGQYTIQLLTACQDETVRRAVDNAHGSSDLFILSTRLEGRNCYRVFWGKYSSQTRAREALRRDVPSSFLQDRSEPRITRIGG